MIEVKQSTEGTAVRTDYIDGDQFVTIIHDNGATSVSTNLPDTCQWCGKPRCYLECEDSREALNGDQDAAADLREEEAERERFNVTVDGIEALLMTMAGEGVDMNNEAIARAVFAAVEGASNNA